MIKNILVLTGIFMAVILSLFVVPAVMFEFLQTIIGSWGAFVVSVTWVCLTASTVYVLTEF